jgi:tetratricopeptide (TPR) repeat protein
MKIKYIITTGLLIHASATTAWVLDESVSSTSNKPKSASESIQADLFEPPEKITVKDDSLDPFKFDELLSKIDLDHESLSLSTKEKIPEIPNTIEPTQKPPFLEKKISSLTPKDLANKQYNLALQKIELGLHAEAEQMFVHILKDYPQHTLSRVQLSKLSILKNDYEKAEKWLNENPDYFSSHPAYLQTLALIYERTGKKREALKILEQVPAQHRKNVEFYSLLASLYQQTGNHVLAQRYYNGLLNREPNNTTWLLGLSISLDSGGEKKMALSHYKKILEKGELEPKILSFVQDRVKKLSGK